MTVGPVGIAEVPPKDRSFSIRAPREGEAWIGFGTNLGNRSANIDRALDAFSGVLESVSPIYETAPWGVLDQPWFLNGVARLRWDGDAPGLLDLCLSTERSLGRIRTVRFGPRIIDLDVLLLGPSRVQEAGLTIPHPGIPERRSVLEPWADLSPDLVVPGIGLPLGLLRERARALTGQEVRLFSPIPSGTSSRQLADPALQFATSEQ